MVGIGASEEASLTRWVITKVFALLMSISVLAGGIPLLSTDAGCASGCSCETGNSGISSAADAHVRSAAPGCCSVPEDRSCATALDKGFLLKNYVLAGKSSVKTRKPMIWALEGARVGPSDQSSPRATGPWKAPPATPGAPLYLSHLSLRI
jgi:hypothetical protein